MKCKVISAKAMWEQNNIGTGSNFLFWLACRAVGVSPSVSTWQGNCTKMTCQRLAVYACIHFCGEISCLLAKPACTRHFIGKTPRRGTPVAFLRCLCQSFCHWHLSSAFHSGTLSALELQRVKVIIKKVFLAFQSDVILHGFISYNY